jgi:hypothetical protein
LLVAATKPPVGGLILLEKLEETLILNGRRFELSANGYPGLVHPPGKLILPMQLKMSMMHSLRISSRRFRRGGDRRAHGHRGIRKLPQQV